MGMHTLCGQRQDVMQNAAGKSGGWACSSLQGAARHLGVWAAARQGAITEGVRACADLMKHQVYLRSKETKGHMQAAQTPCTISRAAHLEQVCIQQVVHLVDQPMLLLLLCWLWSPHVLDSCWEVAVGACAHNRQPQHASSGVLRQSRQLCWWVSTWDFVVRGGLLKVLAQPLLLMTCDAGLCAKDTSEAQANSMLFKCIVLYPMNHTGS